MLDLALLLRRQRLFPLPRFRAGIAGHDAAERFDFGDDVGELEMLNLLADLRGRLVADRTFSEICLAMVPANVETGRGGGDRFRNALFIDLTGLAILELAHRCGSRLVASGTVGTERQEVPVVAAERDQDRLRHVEGNETEQGTSIVIVPRGCRSLAVEEAVATLPDEVVLVAEFGDQVAPARSMKRS